MSDSLKKKKVYNIAVVGATGAVGMTFVRLLEARNFPVNSLKLLASERSVGKKIDFKGQTYSVEFLNDESFKDIDIAFFSAGASISKVYAKIAVASGATVIDNSSAFRLVDDVPLVVPEVNPEEAFKHNGIIANPNCTTAILLVALKPLYDYTKIRRVVVASYQAASGAGAKAMDELINQTYSWANNGTINVSKFQYQLLFNVIPHIDVFTETGYTKEEMKMYDETKKILGDNDIKVSATCVRVPVLTAHSEAVVVDCENEITVEKAKELFSRAKGVKLYDEIMNNIYPMPLISAGKDDVYVGRIRKDLAFEHGIAFWVSGDQLRKGGALNAIQIAELISYKSHF